MEHPVSRVAILLDFDSNYHRLSHEHRRLERNGIAWLKGNSVNVID